MMAPSIRQSKVDSSWRKDRLLLACTPVARSRLRSCSIVNTPQHCTAMDRSSIVVVARWHPTRESKSKREIDNREREAIVARYLRV